MRFNKIIAFIALFTAAPGLRTTAQTWVVPDDQKAIVAPEKFTPDMQKQGEQIYLKNCQSCHGLPGKDNWARLTPPPGDLSKEKAQNQTDGELFYRITTGKSPMPEFRNIIPEGDRWSVISYLRTFNPKYVQPEPAGMANFSGRIITLSMQYNDQMKKIVVNATEKLKDGSTAKAAGVEVMLTVKRYFGKLQLGDIRTTNVSGETTFEFPADLPGNKEGFVELTASVNDPKGLMKSTPATGTFAIGVPMTRPGLTDTKEWWTTRDKTPTWIAITYTGSVLIVWGFIFYILFLVLKIRKIGNA